MRDLTEELTEGRASATSSKRRIKDGPIRSSRRARSTRSKRSSPPATSRVACYRFAVSIVSTLAYAGPRHAHDAGDAGDPVLHLDAHRRARRHDRAAGAFAPDRLLSARRSYTWLATPEEHRTGKNGSGSRSVRSTPPALGADAAAAKIAALLAERATIVEEWRSHVEQKEHRLRLDGQPVPAGKTGKYTLEILMHCQQERIETIRGDARRRLEAPRIHSRVRELVNPRTRAPCHASTARVRPRSRGPSCAIRSRSSISSAHRTMTRATRSPAIVMQATQGRNLGISVADSQRRDHAAIPRSGIWASSVFTR